MQGSPRANRESSLIINRFCDLSRTSKEYQFYQRIININESEFLWHLINMIMKQLAVNSAVRGPAALNWGALSGVQGREGEWRGSGCSNERPQTGWAAHSRASLCRPERRASRPGAGRRSSSWPAHGHQVPVALLVRTRVPSSGTFPPDLIELPLKGPAPHQSHVHWGRGTNLQTVTLGVCSRWHSLVSARPWAPLLAPEPGLVSGHPPRVPRPTPSTAWLSPPSTRELALLLMALLLL